MAGTKSFPTRSLPNEHRPQARDGCFNVRPASNGSRWLIPLSAAALLKLGRRGIAKASQPVWTGVLVIVRQPPHHPQESRERVAS